ncbi:MAG: hypothetical protein A2Y38_02935 [Spirochaetes bacterium GWB1_59_5]|nr:MAG: hypothetical protein A2Y38_02935 [Spirochaetes bacterium GWB1_59_5]
MFKSRTSPSAKARQRKKRAWQGAWQVGKSVLQAQVQAATPQRKEINMANGDGRAAIGFAVGTGVAAGTAAAVRAWWPVASRAAASRWADAIGAGAGVGLGLAARYVRPLRHYSNTIMAGAAISQTPRIVETLITGVAASQGLVAVERLGLVQAQRINQLSGAIDVRGNANVGSHFGSVPLAGAH